MHTGKWNFLCLYQHIYKNIYKIMLDSISSHCKVCKLQIYLHSPLPTDIEQAYNTPPSMKKSRGKWSISCHLFQRYTMVHWPKKIQEHWVLLPAMEWNVFQETGNCTRSPQTWTPSSKKPMSSLRRLSCLSSYPTSSSFALRVAEPLAQVFLNYCQVSSSLGF